MSDFSFETRATAQLTTDNHPHRISGISNSLKIDQGDGVKYALEAGIGVGDSSQSAKSNKSCRTRSGFEFCFTHEQAPAIVGELLGGLDFSLNDNNNIEVLAGISHRWQSNRVWDHQRSEYRDRAPEMINIALMRTRISHVFLNSFESVITPVIGFNFDAGVKMSHVNDFIDDRSYFAAGVFMGVRYGNSGRQMTVNARDQEINDID